MSKLSKFVATFNNMGQQFGNAKGVTYRFLSTLMKSPAYKKKIQGFKRYHRHYHRVSLGLSNKRRGTRLRVQRRQN